MRYVEYGYVKDDKFQEACGDRSIVILDERNSIGTSIQDALNFNGKHRPVYDAFRICEGESLCRSTPVTQSIQA